MGDHPEYYVAGDADARQVRLDFLDSMVPKLKPFFDCLKKGN